MTSHKIQSSDGHKIAYEVIGKGEPLVLIMGLGAPGSTWEKHLLEYKKEFQCIVIDNRGAGRSSRPIGPYSTLDMAYDTLAVVDALNLSKFHLAGLSMGGAIAQELALKIPERLNSLLLISTWGKCNPYTLQLFNHFCNMRSNSSPKEFMKMLQLWIFSPVSFDNEAYQKELRESIEKSNEGYMTYDAFCSQVSACMTHDALGKLSAISSPTLITVGEKDIFTPPSFSIDMHNCIQDSELLIFPNTGHCHHWESLDLFNKKTTEFFKNN